MNLGTTSFKFKFYAFEGEQSNVLATGELESVGADMSHYEISYPDGRTEILFTPLSPFETPEALDRICEEYNKVIGNFEVEPLIAIPIFVHDFLCIHPFNDGNGRMSRLLTLLLLYRSGYIVGKYISIEKVIETSKDTYYEALQSSSQGWHEEENDYAPFAQLHLTSLIRHKTLHPIFRMMQ